MDTVTVQTGVGITVAATGEASLITSHRVQANLGSAWSPKINLVEHIKCHATAGNKKEDNSLHVTFYQAVLLLCSNAERSNS